MVVEEQIDFDDIIVKRVRSNSNEDGIDLRGSLASII